MQKSMIPKKGKEFHFFFKSKRMTHPTAVENGDLFSSADDFGFVDELVDVLQDCCVAVPPTTF